MNKYSKSKLKRVTNRSSAQDQHEIEEAEIVELIARRREEAPARGSQPSSNGELRFDSMPLSKRTIEGLALAKLQVATEIQAAAIPHALAGRDILGAAKTGSGKTLAFVIPLVEKLYMERWGPGDGLAAVIVTPTRELALQIFEVIRIVGRKHQFSAGLITGGRKDFEGEQERITSMNILVATPGRLLQHLQQTVGFDASQVMTLVLDEADRILDMGFKTQLDGILEYLPAHCQTLLFSATQTKSVKDLARLSLKEPEYLAVHAEDKEATPDRLVQNYIVTSLPEKLDVLFSFIKCHLKSKIIVFFSTCSQVRYVYECFRGMQPGIPLSALHGKIKQEKRTAIFMDFTRRKSACLLATDIAARGLDFPSIDWVIQADAPEDTAMYIHRVGRTARYTATGRALLLLTPHEERTVLPELMQAQQQQKQHGGSSAGSLSPSSSSSVIPIKKLTVNPNRKFSVAAQAAALLAAQPEVRTLAKKAFTSYIRSLQLLPGKKALTGDVAKIIPVDEFAASLGLAFAPPLPSLPTAAGGKATSSATSADGGDGMGVGEEVDAEAAREAVRSQKNVNRSLDKLKRQIKEAKEERRRAREALREGAKAKDKGKGKARKNPTEEDSSTAPGGTTTSTTTKAKVGAGAGNDDDSSEDDLLVVKAKHTGSGRSRDGGGGSSSSSSDSSDDNNTADGSGSDSDDDDTQHRINKKESAVTASISVRRTTAKAPVLKIDKTTGVARVKLPGVASSSHSIASAPGDGTTVSTTVSTAGSGSGSGIAKAKKIVFDDDGNMMEGGLRLIDAKQSQSKFQAQAQAQAREEQQRAIEARMAAARLRVDESRAEDEQRERQRLREKRLKLKAASRAELDQQMGARAAVDGVAVLDSVDGHEESDSGSDSSDDGGYGGDRAGNVRGVGDSEGSDDDDDDDNERSISADSSEDPSEHVPTSGSLKRSKRRSLTSGSARKKSRSGSSTGVDTHLLRQQEALVMSMLGDK